MLKSILIKIEYEGSRYKGWQVQPDLITIQGVIQAVFQRICQQDVNVTAVSRTDSGVHARGQIARLRVPSSLSLRKLYFSSNALLPDDIAITDMVQVEDTYSPKKDSLGKRYIYRILNGPVKKALGHNMSLWVRQSLDFEKIKSAALSFVGTHDFKSFQGKGCQQTVTTKTIFKTDCLVDHNDSFKSASIIIEGSGFLKNMVRIMVGTLLEVGRNRRPESSIKSILESRQRDQAGVTVPPDGLILDEIFLKSDPFDSRTGPSWNTE